MEKENISTKRLIWIDALRAMAMLFVVFGHQVMWFDDFFLYTTPIKIPLFFAISGYLFKDRNGVQSEFFHNWFRKLVMPYFFLVTIPAVPFSLHYGCQALLDSWCKMLSGESYWFLTCLIVAEVIFFYIKKISKTILHTTFLCLISMLAGFVLSRIGILNYAKINTALICQMYLLLGMIYKQYEDQLGRINIWVLIGLLLLYVLLCFSSQYIFEDITFDCNLNKYYNVGYCMLLIMLGCTTCFLLAKKVTRFPKFLIYIGQNTILLYLWAGYALLLFVVLSKLGFNIPSESLIVSSIQTIWAVFACMCAAWFVKKYFPFVLGMR